MIYTKIMTLNNSFKVILYKHRRFIIFNKCNGLSCVQTIIVFFEAYRNAHFLFALRTNIGCPEILVGISPIFYKSSFNSALLASIAEQAFIHKRTVNTADCVRFKKELFIKRLIARLNIFFKILRIHSSEAQPMRFRTFRESIRSKSGIWGEKDYGGKLILSS